MNSIKKNCGVTLIEISIALAIIGILSIGGTKFFQDTFSVWMQTRDVSRAVGDSRVALDEISTYIRQASTSPITASGTSIIFEIDRAAADWPGDRTIRYYRDGDKLMRVMRGITTTLVSEGIEDFHVWHVLAGTATYELVGASVTVRQGSDMGNLELNRRIMLRGRRESQ